MVTHYIQKKCYVEHSTCRSILFAKYRNKIIVNENLSLIYIYIYVVWEFSFDFYPLVLYSSYSMSCSFYSSTLSLVFSLSFSISLFVSSQAIWKKNTHTQSSRSVFSTYNWLCFTSQAISIVSNSNLLCHMYKLWIQLKHINNNNNNTYDKHPYIRVDLFSTIYF